MMDWTKSEKYALASVADCIREELANNTVVNDTIHLCKDAALFMLRSRPSDALQLAERKLYTWPFDEVPAHWRRLYEDACLRLAAESLSQLITPKETATTGKCNDNDGERCERLFCEAIKYLDQALFTAGAPGRRAFILALFSEFEDYLQQQQQGNELLQMTLNVEQLPSLITDHTIRQIPNPLSLEAFQKHLDSYGGPMVIHKTFWDWPANERWPDASYLLKRTLGGRRVVPVEIGSSYTDASWTQQTMPFLDFLNRFVITEQPDQMGYLAQHDLLSQMPAFRDDIRTPDYCYTTPPKPQGAAAKTYGLDETPLLDEPTVNAWLGPKGTKTPLHTDAYHNILCQVVGYKYVRLYAPEERDKLYPRGINESSINMANTSSIDVHLVSSEGKTAQMDPLQELEVTLKFPKFQEAKYQEVILSPGQCLYVPLGWWHYVESLSTSFSVSFWFN